MSEKLTIQCWNPQQAHQAMTAQLWPMLKAMLMATPEFPGIYQITCSENGRIYIGSSNKVKQRLARHFQMLDGKKHENSKLQNSFDKYGESSFYFQVLEVCPVDCLFPAEQKWIDKYWEFGILFNLVRVASRPPSFAELNEASRESKREKHRVGSTGRPVSQALLDHLATRVGAKNPGFGKKHPPERVEALRKRMTGPSSPSYGKKGVDCPIYGIKRSEETRKLMSENSAWNGVRGALHFASIPCIRTTSDGVVHKYDGLNQASRDVGFCCSTIAKWCKGKRKPRDGSIWRYA